MATKLKINNIQSTKRNSKLKTKDILVKKHKKTNGKNKKNISKNKLNFKKYNNKN